MGQRSRLSARVSRATKRGLLRFSAKHGLKQRFVVEQALLDFMEARRAFPDAAVIPARLVLSNGAFDTLVNLLETRPAPTDRLRALMRATRVRRRARP